MPTHDENIYTDDGASIREDVINRRKEDVTDIYQKLNASMLLASILKTTPGLVIKREDMLDIRNSEPIVNGENVNPYNEGYTDYLKELGGHILVQYDEKSDEIKFTLCSEVEGDRVIQEGNCIGFFSIRRPWNMQGWGNSVYKRQFPYVKEEENGSN
jgi:hypothetical protein